MLCYGGLITLLALGRLDRLGMGWVVAAHLLVMLLPVLARRAPDDSLLRIIYPVLLLPAFYSSIDVLNGFGGGATHDAVLLRIEQAVFGMQPARDWHLRWPSHFWSTVLHATYFSYYIIVPLPMVIFLVQRDRAALERYLGAVITTFLACYVVYALWPVAGPYYVFDHPTGSFIANAPARWVYAGLAGGSAYGAAFPSSHVAATVAACIAAWRERTGLGLVLAVPAALLAVGVVYCQMHYVIDSVAGLAIGVLVPIAARRVARPTR